MKETLSNISVVLLYIHAWRMCHRYFLFYRANRKSPDERAENAYEMSNDETSQPAYTTVQSGASAPAGNTGAGDQSTNATSSVDNGRVPPAASSSYQDITLIDNDLYE